MKICIPTKNGKLCKHFGHCDSFTFAEINPKTRKILSIKEKIPKEGISCQSSAWISELGVNKVLANEIGGRPMMAFAQNGVEVITGCPELPIKEILKKYLENTLERGENVCGDKEHNHVHCHHHKNGYHYHH